MSDKETLIPVVNMNVVGGFEGISLIDLAFNPGRQLFFRQSDAELVDEDGNICSHQDPMSRNVMCWKFGIGDKPEDIVLLHYGVKWGELSK